MPAEQVSPQDLLYQNEQVPEAGDSSAADVPYDAPADVPNEGHSDGAAEVADQAGEDTADLLTAPDEESELDIPADVCQPNCVGKECGDDGCGGKCGVCVGPGDECVGGVCLCMASCGGKECGPDGCGGGCGECPVGKSCVEGLCLLGTECFDGNDEPLDGCDQGKITEFRVDESAFGFQWMPDVAPLGNGGYVCVWVQCPEGPSADPAQGGDGDGCGIFGRLVVPGEGATGQFQVNAGIVGHQRWSRVATDGMDTAMAIWLNGWATEVPLKARLLDAKSGPVGEDVTLAVLHDGGPGKCSSGAICPTASVAACNAGFVAAWSSYNLATGSWQIWVQRFTLQAVPLCEPSVVNTSTEDVLYYPSVLCLDTGEFLVGWGSGNLKKYVLGYYCDGCDIRARRFGKDGVPVGGEFLAAPPPLPAPDRLFAMTETAGGWFAFFWSGVWLLQAGKLGPDGMPEGTSVVAGPFEVKLDGGPHVARLSEGDLRLVWGLQANDGTGQIGTQMLDQTGQPKGGVQWLGSSQLDNREPVVGALPDGTSVVVWHRHEAPGIYALRLDADGNKLYH